MFEHIRDPSDRVRAVCDYGCQVDVDKNIPAKRYYRSGKEMLRMAKVYEEEGNLESAFVLYSKFITLFVEKLPQHPDYKSVPAQNRKENTGNLKEVFPVAEQIKKKLLLKYVTQEEKRREAEKKQREIEEKEAEERRKREAEEKRKQEIEEKKKQEQKSITEGLGIPENFSDAEYKRMVAEQEEEFRRLQILEQQKIDRAKQQVPETQKDKEQEEPQFPTVPPPAYGDVIGYSAEKDHRVLPPHIPDRSLKPKPMAPPSVPPTAPPSLPLTTPTPASVPPAVTTPQIPAADQQSATPEINRSLKPSSHMTDAGHVTGNQFNLKTVNIPEKLMTEFLRLAQHNTNLQIETGGFLFGKMSQSQFHITHLVLPKQVGKPDSFMDQSSEEELIIVQDQHDVIQLGWIHTHPTQNAFLSSIDQHQQFSFQSMLPESVAVVCSPKFDETGIFYLTPDFGVDYIRKCTGRGFHEHQAVGTIFESCPHVNLDATAGVQVIDLR